MKRKPRTASPTPRTTIKTRIITKKLFAKGRGRLAAFLILALLATAGTVITISSAQSRKKGRAKAQTSSAKRQTSSKRTPAERLFKIERGGTERAVQGEREQENEGRERTAAPVDQRQRKAAFANLKPKETRMNRAKPFNGDLRGLPYIAPVKKEKPEREPPRVVPVPYNQSATTSTKNSASASPAQESSAPELSAPAPAPLSTFIGLDFANWGAGRPPDTVGDVGPTYFIQSVNSSVGVYRKSDGVRVAAFTLDTFMSQGNFGNFCDTDNFGDPVILYDTFEDRWVITDFAFQLDASDNVSPQIALQCLAVSKTGDPVSGGWNFYSINTTGGLGDYPKYGIWPDGIYMSTNMFDYAASGSFQNPRLYAFNKAQMYAGSPTVQIVQFDLPATEFALLPSNARLQTGTPPAGSPNYLTEVWNFLNTVSVYKFHVDWNSISLSTLTGPFDSVTPTWWAQYSDVNGTVPTPSQANDTLYPRLMMQNQYSNIGGVESLWNSQTAGAGNPTTNVSSAQAAVRYYQVNVTGGTVAANTVQNFTYSPDATIHRYMPSSAVDRAGNFAIGYSTSNSTTHPGIKYAGRLSTDAINTISQTEQTLFQGTGSQNTSNRWGDYAAMTLDPDGCTFWLTSEYYAVTGGDWQTRIGSFKFAQCTPVGGGGVVSGTVTANPGGAPLQSATVMLGSRSTTTDASGNYSFSVPAGTYPGMTATFPGRNGASATSVVVADGNITTRNFSLTAAATSGCLTDTTQADFLLGVPTNTDLTTSAGDVKLSAPVVVDQHADDNGFGSGYGFSSTAILGQTFTPATTGELRKVDINIFCASCSGTNPNITVEIRTTSGGNPVMTAGGLLATQSIAGTSSGSGGFLTATFTTPATVTAAVQYGIVVRLVSNRTTGTQAWAATSGDTYAGGRRKTCSTTTCANPTGSNANSDLIFREHVYAGFTTSGDLVSSLKDANPAAGNTANWGTFSWTATTPASTAVKFQAAASNNSSGPFSFVGPDGTASTFYTTSGGSLAQFNGKRYLKYKALLTGISSASPTLSDVTVCFTDVASIATSSLAASAATGTYGGTVNLSATLTASAVGVSGKSIAFTLNGNSVGSATTNGSGVATLSNVSLAGINAGSYPTGVGASFAGDSGYTASSGSASLTVNKADQTITFGALADKTYGDADFGVSASASSGLSLSFAASGNCTVSGSTVHITGAGSCTITASQAGDSNYNAAPNVPRTFNIAKAAATVTLSNLSHTYDGSPKSAGVSTTPGGLSVTVTYDGSTTAPTGAGSYAVVATITDNNYQGSASDTLVISKADQTITFGALSDKTYGDPDFNVSASASSGLTVSFGATGNCSVTGTTVHITGAGSCTITASQGGDSNYNAATNVPQSFNIAKASATVTLSNLSQTYDGTAKSASATTNPNGLNVVITYGTGSSARRRNVASVTPIDAGSYTVTATIDDPNYEGSATDTLVISKADATISVTGYTGAYDGNAHGATGSATGAQSEDLSSLLHLGATYTNVPGGTANWTFDGNNNYNSDSGSVSIDISKATPVITWNNPAAIVYGTALSGTQLNASASTAGSYTYTPAAGTVLSSGNGQNLHVEFAPTDTANYNNASGDVSINVLSAVLSTTMIADRNPALVGYNHNYKVAVANTGNASATNLSLTDVLPTKVSFTAVSTSQGTCAYASATRTVTCNLGTLPAGSTANVQITVKPREEGTLDDTATITASQWDPATGNSSASVNGLQSVAQVDVSVSKVDSADPIFVGDQTIYTMTVKNQNTPINATGIVLTDSLPAGLTFVSASTSQGTLVTPPVDSSGIVTANIGTLAPNATATITITVKGAAAGTFTNTATVTENETDTATMNNTASQSTTVKPVVTVTLQKVLLASQVLTGGCQNTTGNVYLTAPAPAGGVTVSLSSNISGASVPASVFIAGGQMVSPAFNVTTSPVTAKQVGLITATSGSSSVSRGITINVGNGTCP